MLKKLLIALLLMIIAENLFAQGFHFDGYNYDVKLKKDYLKATEEFNYRTGKKPLDFYIDFQLGIGGTSANISGTGSNNYETNSKLGFTTGALFYISIFDVVKFSSGLSFDGKSFSYKPLNVVDPDPNQDTTKTEKYVTANYLNIPLNFNLGGMLSEDFGLWFNGGPYFGILTSSPDNQKSGLGFKNFDLGLNGTLTANYVFAYPLSVIFGANFKYGGLNNLGSTKTVDAIHTLNYAFFSGLRFSL